MTINVSEHDGGVFFSVRVVPRASKSEIVGEHDGSLKVRICSPPVDGAANAELVRVFARHFRVSKGEIAILSGQTMRNKRIRIENLSLSRFEELIK